MILIVLLFSSFVLDVFLAGKPFISIVVSIYIMLFIQEAMGVFFCALYVFCKVFV